MFMPQDMFESNVILDRYKTEKTMSDKEIEV